MTTEAFQAAKANARDVLDAAFRAQSPMHAAQVRADEGPAICDAIEAAIATALVMTRAGLASQPTALATLPLADFLGPARELNDSVRVLGVYAAPEWDELSDDGKQWLAAFLRETLAHVPGELERLREEVAFWRSDLAARLLFDTSHLEAERARGNTDAAVTIELRIRSNLAAYNAAEAGDWHNRCDICGDFVRPGEPYTGGEDVSGHWRCLTDDPAPPGRDLAPGVDLAVRVARAREVLDAGKPPVPRPLMVPCPDCPDGFVTHGDRHARTAKDVCKRCGGTHQVPAATGTSAETSAPPVEPHPTALVHVVAAPGADPADDVWTLSRDPRAPGWTTDGGCPGYGLPKLEAEAYAQAINAAALPAPGSFLDPVPALYRNWEGEERIRMLAPSLAPGGPLVWCPKDQWHEAGWRIRCLDAEAGHIRLYPLSNILAWGPEALLARAPLGAAVETLRALGWTYTMGEPRWKRTPGREYMHRRKNAAHRTLLGMGYTYERGAMLWKPPPGPAPDFAASERRAQIVDQLRDYAGTEIELGHTLRGLLGEAADVLAGMRLSSRYLPDHVVERLSDLASAYLNLSGGQYSDGVRAGCTGILGLLRDMIPPGWSMTRMGSEEGPMLLHRVAAVQQGA